ncbi:MAG TPA: DUF2993 domain-containing protein [Pseudonocardiaceae bacterium]
MRKLVIAVLVLVGLAVTADYAAAAAAEYEVAKQIRQKLVLAADPSVRINGFPFLTQALVGNYSDIDLRATGLSVGPLHDVAVEATMRDVDAPLSELRSGDLASVRVAEVNGRVRISDRDIGRAIGIEDLRLQPASDEEIRTLLPAGSVPGSDNPAGNRAAVRMAASTDLAGQRTGVIGIGVIQLIGSRLQITVVDVRLSRDNVGEVSLPHQIRQTLIQALSTDLQPGGLPFNVTPTRVWVEPGSLVAEGTAQGVTMSQAAKGVG